MNQKIVYVNAGNLNKREYRDVKRWLSHVGMFEKKKRIFCSKPKSTVDVVYSVDCGAKLSELDSFLLEVEFYLGKHLSKVTITSIDF